MSIELHCPKCGKLIRAPDNAGGRHGKCPYCKESVYVPLPPDDSEEIGLAPVDDEALQRAAELKRESARYVAAVDHDTDVSPDTGGADDPSPDGDGPPGLRGEVIDIDAEVESYIVAMRDSKLDQADAAANRLKTTGQDARGYIQRLMEGQSPLEVEGVPPPVVKGFLKALLDRLD